MSYPCETWWNWSPHEVIIFTRFHKDRPKKCEFFTNGQFLNLSNFFLPRLYKFIKQNIFFPATCFAYLISEQKFTVWFHLTLYFDFRSNVSDGPFLWRSLFDIRSWGNCVRGARPRGSAGPAHLRVPADDQMHIPQIWYFRRSGETWRTVSAPAQHRQRESLHLPLVLVHPSQHP